MPNKQSASPAKANKSYINADRVIAEAVLMVSENGHRCGFSFTEIAEAVGPGVSKTVIKKWLARHIEAGRIEANQQSYTCISQSRIREEIEELRETILDAQNKLSELEQLKALYGVHGWTPLPPET